MSKLKEINLVRKKLRRGMVKVALVYPSFYSVAASSLAYQMLYYYLNSIPEFYVERIVLPSNPDTSALSIESGWPLSRFDLAVISVHYEPDYAGILRILLSGKVEARSQKREKPIVIAGGPPIISNPEPIADVLDVAVIGEIESTLPTFVEKLLEYFPDKKELLDSLKPEEGFYVPSRGREKTVISYAVPLPRSFHPIAQFRPLTRVKGLAEGIMVETNRGCFRMCAFCMEGHIFSYMRERPLSDVLHIIDRGVEVNRLRKIRFISLSFFDYSRAGDLLAAVAERGLEASIPSLRAETLDRDKLELMKNVGQKSLTIAPETGSPRLAMILRKYIPLERALEVASEARKVGFSGLKLYFMVGIPGEEKSDLDADVDYIKKLAETGFKGNRALKVTISPLVPKPHTSFERAPWIGVEEARRRIQYIRRRLGGLADVRPYDPRWAEIQTVISRGGRELLPVLVEWAYRGGGLGAWRSAVRKSGADVSRYLEEIRGELPWSHIVVPRRARVLRESEVIGGVWS